METIPPYSEKHTKPINTLWQQNAELMSVNTDWYIQLPLGFKGLRKFKHGNLYTVNAAISGTG
jgi:hypothetical protein